MRVCDLTGTRPLKGHFITRRGLSKKSGGVGIKTTAVNPRRFFPNLHLQRLWVPELKRFVRVRLTAKALRSAQKKGLYQMLMKAGVLNHSIKSR